MVTVRSVLKDVYNRLPPESIPLSVGDVDGRNCNEYFLVGLDDDGFPIGGQVTVMDESSASTNIIPSSPIFFSINQVYQYVLYP